MGNPGASELHRTGASLAPDKAKFNPDPRELALADLQDVALVSSRSALSLTTLNRPARHRLRSAVQACRHQIAARPAALSNAPIS
jgi:hypothetical protein